MDITKFLNLYGRRARFEEEDGWTSRDFHCFIQPLRYKNKMYLYGVNTQIGFNAQGNYLYIGPPDCDVTKLSDDVVLHVGENRYRIDRAEKVYCGEKLYYIWAIIRTVVEESEESL